MRGTRTDIFYGVPFARYLPTGIRLRRLEPVFGLGKDPAIPHLSVTVLDGKTCASFDTAFGQTHLHLVSAWAVRNRLILGAVPTQDKSNESHRLPAALLRLLDITGCTVTIDAMGCHKAIAKQIKGQGWRLMCWLSRTPAHF